MGQRYRVGKVLVPHGPGHELHPDLSCQSGHLSLHVFVIHASNGITAQWEGFPRSGKLRSASGRMTGMIEMPPPPEPPVLEPEKIRALIDYAEKMAEFMEAEMQLQRELGKATPENDLSGLVTGWRFTAQGLRDSYDQQF